MERRLAELDRLDELYGVGTHPHQAPRESVRRRRQSGAALPGLLITALLLGGIVALTPTDDMRTLRRLFGFGDDRLAAAPPIPSGDGSYRFSLTQRNGDPVGYDPCRPIELHVNPAGAPDDYEDLVRTAIDRTEDATGLRFDYLGLTDDRDLEPTVLGPGRRPVLVAWASEDELPDLAGDVAGIGGSAAVSSGNGRLSYVTGVVVLDAEVFADVDDDDRPLAQAIVDHEFGHLVGLDHVTDPGELMNAENLGVTTYGPGDLEGLARLGRIDC